MGSNGHFRVLLIAASAAVLAATTGCEALKSTAEPFSDTLTAFRDITAMSYHKFQGRPAMAKPSRVAAAKARLPRTSATLASPAPAVPVQEALFRKSSAAAPAANRKSRTQSKSISTPAFLTPSNTTNDALLRNRHQIALLIAIDDYSAFSRLDNAVGDARAVGRVLREQYGFERVCELYNDDATKMGILAAVREVVETMQEGDDLLIYYAGHGWQDTVLDEGYWIPYGAADQGGFLANSEIHHYIGAMEKAQHVFVVADSCFSGRFLSRSVRVTAAGADARLTEYFRRMDNRKSRVVFSSGGLEPVADGGRAGHSVFAYYFLRALESPDRDVFTDAVLAQRVAESVGDNADQQPVMGCLEKAGSENGQMVFVRSPRKPVAFSRLAMNWEP